MKTSLSAVIGSLALFVATACGGDGHDMSRHNQALAAPTDLSAAVVAGGVHLTWHDNSTGEEEFMILRKDAASAWAGVGSAPADATSFHDATVAPGRTYWYVVHAMRGELTSAPTNEISIAVP